MIPAGKALVVKKSESRRQKLLKKSRNGDAGIVSIENYFECLMFGIDATASIEIFDDSTRASSKHDLNINEVQLLLLSLLLGRNYQSKFIKLRNAPFIERIVILHFSDCYSSYPPPRDFISQIMPSFTFLMSFRKLVPRTKDSKEEEPPVRTARVSGGYIVRIDKEIRRQSFMHYKLLTMPLRAAAEYRAELLEADKSVQYRSVKSNEDMASGATAVRPEGVGSKDEVEVDLLPFLLKTMEPYVLTPSLLSLWGFPLNAVNSVPLTVQEELASSVAERPTKIRKILHSSDQSQPSTVTAIPHIGVNEGGHLIPSIESANAFLHSHCGTCVDSLDRCWFETLDLPTRSSAVADEYDTVGAVIVAVDCEMCEDEVGNLQLARISLVSYDDTVILDALVKPVLPIKDYLTVHSGITESTLKDVTVTFSQIRATVLKLIRANTFLVGHSLDSDLKALKLVHRKCIDTAIIYPHPYGFPYRLKLRKLAEDYLNVIIQRYRASHDSIEDAKATMQLAILKARNGHMFGVRNVEEERMAMLNVPCGRWLDTFTSSLTWQVLNDDDVIQKVGADDAATNAAPKSDNENKIIDEKDLHTKIAAVGDAPVVSPELGILKDTDTLPLPPTASEPPAVTITNSTMDTTDVPAAKPVQHKSMQSVVADMKYMMEKCVGGEQCEVLRAKSIDEILDSLRKVMSTDVSQVVGRGSQSLSPKAECVVPVVESSDDQVSSWIDMKSAAGKEVTNVIVPKRQLHFFELNYRQLLMLCARMRAPTANYSNDRMMYAANAIKFIKNALYPTDNTESTVSEQGKGKTLVLVTAQTNITEVLKQLRAKSAACKNPMSIAGALWSEKQDLALEQDRKYSIGYMSTMVV